MDGDRNYWTSMAASLRIAEQYIQAFSKITKEGTTMLLPSTAANPTSMMAQAMTIYKNLIGDSSGGVTHEITHSGTSPNSNANSSARQGSESSHASDAMKRTSSDDSVSKLVFSLQSHNKRDEDDINSR